ncbi:hypothetical protein X975_18939, partial [Stegodyphus mimosarum]
TQFLFIFLKKIRKLSLEHADSKEKWNRLFFSLLLLNYRPAIRLVEYGKDT